MRALTHSASVGFSNHRHRASHRGAEQDPQLPSRGQQPDAALKRLRANDIVDHELARRVPQGAPQAVEEQQDDRVPHLETSRVEEDGPGEAHGDEQHLRPLHDPAAVEAVRQGAEVPGERQGGQPVADDGEALQGFGPKELVDDAVADDVLDVVGHHRQHVADEEQCENPVSERGERGRCLGGCGWRCAHWVSESPDAGAIRFTLDRLSAF